MTVFLKSKALKHWDVMLLLIITASCPTMRLQRCLTAAVPGSERSGMWTELHCLPTKTLNACVCACTPATSSAYMHSHLTFGKEEEKKSVRMRDEIQNLHNTSCFSGVLGRVMCTVSPAVVQTKSLGLVGGLRRTQWPLCVAEVSVGVDDCQQLRLADPKWRSAESCWWLSCSKQGDSYPFSLMEGVTEV